MFHLVPVLPWLVVFLRFLLPLPWILPIKIIVAGILLVASQHLLINRLSSGSVFAPEYPRPLIILFNLLFGTMVLLAIFQLAVDLVALVIGLVNRSVPAVPVAVRYGIGGMVVGLDRLVARGNGGFVSSMYRVGGMQLYVNNDTGLWPGFALRIGRPSELTVFTLRQM